MKRTPRQPRFNVERAFQRAGDAFIADLKVLLRKATQEALRQALAAQAPAPASVLKAQLSLPLRDAASAATEDLAAAEPEKLSKRAQESVDQRTDLLLEYIETRPGQRFEEISAGLGISAKDLALPMRILVRENHLRLVGEEPTAAYYAR